MGVAVGVGDGETGKDVNDGIGASAAMIARSKSLLNYCYIHKYKNDFVEIKRM